MYSNGIKMACFFQKIAQLLADPSLWYVWVTLVYSTRLPNLDIFTFNFGKPDNGFRGHMTEISSFALIKSFFLRGANERNTR